MSERIRPAVLSEEEAARYVGIGATTLRGKRKTGQLPQGLWVRPAPKRLVYRVALLDRWLDLGCPEAWPPGEPRLAG